MVQSKHLVDQTDFLLFISVLSLSVFRDSRGPWLRMRCDHLFYSIQEGWHEKLGSFLKSLQPMLVGYAGVLASCPFLLLSRTALSASQVPYLEILASSVPPVLSAHPPDVFLSSELTFLDHIFICSLSFIFFFVSFLQHSSKLESPLSALYPCLTTLTSSFSFLQSINEPFSWIGYWSLLCLSGFFLILCLCFALHKNFSAGSDYPLLGKSQSLSAVLIFVDLLADSWYFDRLFGFHASKTMGTGLIWN